MVLDKSTGETSRAGKSGVGRVKSGWCEDGCRLYAGIEHLCLPRGLRTKRYSGSGRPTDPPSRGFPSGFSHDVRMGGCSFPSRLRGSGGFTPLFRASFVVFQWIGGRRAPASPFFGRRRLTRFIRDGKLKLALWGVGLVAYLPTSLSPHSLSTSRGLPRSSWIMTIRRRFCQWRTCSSSTWKKCASCTEVRGSGWRVRRSLF